MKKVLVFGLKDPCGGVENVVMSYVRQIICAHQDIQFNFLIFGESFSLEWQCTDLGGQVIYCPPRREDYKAYQKKMSDIFSEIQYDVVWCNVSGLTNLDVLVQAKKHHVPMRIVHSHVTQLSWGNPLMRVLVPVLHYWNKTRVQQYANAFWACSPEAGAFMFPKSVASKVVVIKNAIDVNVFCAAEHSREETRRELGCDGMVVCHVARMCREKNQLFLLEVMKKIVERESTAKLLFVGDGEMRNAVEAKITELSLEKNVILTGYQTEIAKYLRSSNVLLLPSLSEGLGLSVIEAQASGVPCVVSDTLPREVDISGAVTFMPLSKTAAQWADAVIAASKQQILDPASCVRSAGYDIEVASQKVYAMMVGNDQ